MPVFSQNKSMGTSLQKESIRIDAFKEIKFISKYWQKKKRRERKVRTAWRRKSGVEWFIFCHGRKIKKEK